MAEPVEQMKYTHTKLNGFKQCPLQFHQTVVTGKFKRNWGTKSAQAKRGDELHKAVETALIMKTDELPPNARDGSMVKCYDLMVRSRKSIEKLGDAYSYPELSLAIGEDYEELPYYQDTNGRKFFMGKVDYVTMCAAHSKGKINDRAIILDVKTGKSSYSTRDQLDRMALLIFLNYEHINQIQAAYIWTNEGAKVEKYRYERDPDLRALKDQLAYDVANVEKCDSSGVWPAIPSGLCKKYCPVSRDVCSHSGTV